MKVQWEGDNDAEVRDKFVTVFQKLEPKEDLPCWPVFRDLGTAWPKMEVNWPNPDDVGGAPLTTDVPKGWWFKWTAEGGPVVSMNEPVE